MSENESLTKPTDTSTSFAKKPETIFDLIEKQKPEFSKVLPAIIKPEEFVRVAITVLRMNPKLQVCTPISLLGSLMKAAQTGIMPDNVGAYLIPYKDECSYMLSYKGMIELAMRSGEVAKIESRTIHTNDKFECEFGINPSLSLKPNWADRGEMTAVYAMAVMKDGSSLIEVMSKKDVDDIRSRSAAANRGPWVTDYLEMARKTAVRRLAKYLPQCKGLVGGFDDDELVGLGNDAVEAIKQQTENKTDDLKARLAAMGSANQPAEQDKAKDDGIGYVAGSTVRDFPNDLSKTDLITKETAGQIKKIASKFSKNYTYLPEIIDKLTENAAQDYLSAMNDGEFGNIPFLAKK